MCRRRLTDSSAVGLQSHAAVLLLQELVAQEDPGRVVDLVQPDSPSEIRNGLIVVSTKTVEVACSIYSGHTVVRMGTSLVCDGAI